jgi:Tol biopolymer transport system component
MTVTAPPRPPRPSDPVDRDEVEALVEALIEEARQRTRRRRRIYMAVTALAAVVGVAVFTAFERTGRSQTASPGLGVRSGLPAGTAALKLAFVSYGGGGPANHGTVYVMNADGSGRRTLARGVWDSAPAWSPDGRRLAFVRGVGPPSTATSEIYVVNADGSAERRLTRTSGSEGFPVWSPDGRKIAFVRGTGGGRVRFVSDLYVMNPDGSGQRRVTRNGSGGTWSPDGRKIAFLSKGIRVINADGSGMRRLTSNPGDVYPAWSPDGRKLAFVRFGRCLRCPVNAKLYVMNADGSGQRLLASGEAIHAPPSWSPDGRALAFERAYRPNPKTPRLRFMYVTELYVMNVDGGGQRRLTYGAQPLWSPDGRSIAFVGRRDGNAELYVMNADGSEQRRLTRTPALAEYAFAWSPRQQ